MKYLNTFQDRTGKNVSIEGHTHTKTQITDMPTKLSQFENDVGFTVNAIRQTVSSSSPTSPINGDVWIQLT
ncbi:hypothetical protein M2651_05845 [Clostridium sp. SYSU_GA19001]|uniref:hypothetical protein n=1 Tax=Clostridium caldaquaticum TaxID=2940653 RepID=UPI00207725D0|nr:hypothetical protein [Clostridium caldaquaticum]MCM8710548.1 hypothetical protein [Clostridium caldaquaticum]